MTRIVALWKVRQPEELEVHRSQPVGAALTSRSWYVYLEIIGHEIDNAQQIISDLLEFYRIKTPKTRVVPVHELIQQDLVRCAIPEGISVRCELPETLPKALADPLQMGQVSQNLLINAVQAMPNGDSVRVSARKASSSALKPETDFIEISVADTGKGIAPEHMEKLFQPLFTTKSRGIGLGLAFSKNLTEANGGRIGVESELGMQFVQNLHILPPPAKLYKAKDSLNQTYPT